MAQEFTINSSAIETKINELLPSQGGFAPGVDFSASTMVIPIVDLTETAEGSSLRADLQSSFSYADITPFSIANTTSVILNTTGYYRVYGNMSTLTGGSGLDMQLILTDGSSPKVLLDGKVANADAGYLNFDFIVFISPGIELQGTSGGANFPIEGVTKQLASFEGVLTNPS